jgi:hypothetical protein
MNLLVADGARSVALIYPIDIIDVLWASANWAKWIDGNACANAFPATLKVFNNLSNAFRLL